MLDCMDETGLWRVASWRRLRTEVAVVVCPQAAGVPNEDAEWGTPKMACMIRAALVSFRHSLGYNMGQLFPWSFLGSTPIHSAIETFGMTP